VQNGWLVLDRNESATIDDFGEMFGNETPQPKPLPGQNTNGFAALAVYDKPDQGGNEDGWISAKDKIFPKLRIWIDKNHDGISQPDELFTLDQVGVAEISLTYHVSKRVDANGNIFRYRSTVRDTRGGETSKVIYDVYVDIGGSQSQGNTSAQNVNRDWPLPGTPVGFTKAPNSDRP
jgi:hypothetical protein